ncbi:MAG: CRTAC1 family protein, partial [Phycisphaerae bacterium]
GGFTDVTGEAGLGWTSVAYTGFGTAAIDLDLDGDLDLFVANGRVYLTPPLPNTSLPAPWNRLAEPNLLYLNDGNARFTLAGREGAPLCDQVEITRGVAVGDIDNDGDVDIVVSNVRSRSRIYRNDAPRRGKWLGVRARDPRLKRDALGARVTVTSAGRRVSRTITSGYSYLSSSDPRAHFGLGAMDKIDQVDVKWPDGLHERFRGLQLNRYVELIRGTAEKIDYEPAQTPQTPSLAEKP